MKSLQCDAKVVSDYQGSTENSITLRMHALISSFIAGSATKRYKKKFWETATQSCSILCAVFEYLNYTSHSG